MRQVDQILRNVRRYAAASIVSGLLAIHWFATPALARDAELEQLDIEGLQNFQVVAATKSATRLSETPGAVSVIPYDQIRQSGARTIPELLRRLPGVHVRWNPMVQSIEIRSFGSNSFTSKVLLLIDGVPYNSWNKGGFPQHPGFDFFNLENVKHIEVVRGPGSALYGENALNGVVNIVTLDGGEFDATRLSAYAGNRNTRSLTLSHGQRVGGDGSVFFSVRAENGQLPPGFWADEEAEAQGQDVFLKGRFGGWKLSYYRRQDRFDGFDEPIGPPVLGAGFRSVDEIKQSINIAAVNYDHLADSGAWSVNGSASYADRNGSNCASCHAATQSPEYDEKVDHGYQAIANLQLGVHHVANHEFLLGVELRKIAAGDSFDSQPLAQAQSIDTDYSKHALFVQDSVRLLDNKLKVVAGLRYDSQTGGELFDEEISPRIALVATPIDRLTLRAAWGRASRYPSFTELYQSTRFFGAESAPGVFPLFPPSNFIPNPDLEAETLESLELGIAWQFSDQLIARVDYFNNNIEDPIVVTYSGGVGSENHPNDANVEGFEVDLRYDSGKRVSSYLNWSYQDSAQSGGGLAGGRPIEFSYSPRHKINWGLTWRRGDNFTATLETAWRDKFVGPQFWYNIVFGSPEVFELDGYAYTDLMLRYRLPFRGGGKRPLSLSFHAKNIGNATPIETVIGVNNELPGREFFLGLDYEWE